MMSSDFLDGYAKLHNFSKEEIIFAVRTFIFQLKYDIKRWKKSHD